MGEIFIPTKFPEGDLVKRGQISTYISPDAIEAIINRNPALVHNPEFSDYFKLRLAEHGLAYEGKNNGRSAQADEELKSIREGIAEFEQENPTFQKELTDHLNFIINQYR